jgi:hypothetical protein
MSELLKQLNQKPIAYYPVYRQIAGSTTGGILLSQLMYWFSKKDKYFKTDTEIMDETLLTEKELRNAKKIIKNLDFITVTLEGVPAKTYYEIDWEKLEKIVAKNDKNGQTSTPKRAKQDTPKGRNCDSPKGETNMNNNLITENTTENTSIKNTKKDFKSFISAIKSKVPIKSKVTITDKGYELFKNIPDKHKFSNDYISHQKEKGEYSKRITAFMEDYEFYNKSTGYSLENDPRYENRGARSVCQ